MSWITGLAYKAENILDKLDQNAATALQNQEIPASSPITRLVDSTESLQILPNTAQVMKESVSNKIHCVLPPVLSPSKQTNRNIVTVTKTKTNLTTHEAETTPDLGRVNMPNISSIRHSSRSSPLDLVAIDIDSTSSSRPIIARIGKDFNSAFNNESDAGEIQELIGFKIALSEVTCERDDRQRHHALIHDSDNSCLRQRCNELEILAQRLTAEKNQVESHLTEAQSSKSAYMQSISELESNLAKSHQKNFELAQKLQMQLKETAQQRQDLEEYRKKALRTLQIKDNLIAELKLSSSGSSVDAIHEDTNELYMIKIDLKSAKQELQSLREEKAFLLQHLEEARKDLKDSSIQHSAVIASMISKEDALNKAMRLEKQHSMQVESEQRVLSQELATLRQQLNNQMVASATKLQDSAQLIPLLKAENNSICANDEIYKMRIKSLTETLVNKQNCVELITADRNALRIQLEKVQDHLRQINFQGNSSSNRGQRNILLSNTTDDVKAQFPLLMKETPFDNRVARRVKRVYSSLDSAGIRLGAFLRRYPLMRTLVLIYAQSTPNIEYRFPPSISVQRLAPQVQKQIRETQELTKESGPSFPTEYGIPGPQVRSQTRKPTRRPTLESKFSQELS